MGATNSEDTRLSLISIVDEIDFFYHVGDFGYSDDLPRKEFETVWNTFQNEIQPLSAYKSYMTCPGNHEADCHNTGFADCNPKLNNFTAYRHRFHMPALESGSGAGNMWFSFNYSYVHFISISTETDYDKSPEGRGTIYNTGPFGDQLKWFEQDLQQANAYRDIHPWIIVIGHRPLYTSLGVDFPPDAADNLRTAIESLLYTYKVDLFLCGHVHAYERMYPTYNNLVQQANYNNPNVTTYIVAGNAGNIEGHTTHWKLETPEYLAFRNDQDYGYGILDIFNETTLSWSMYAATNKTMLDHIDLVRQR